jgi:hypothetical protein
LTRMATSLLLLPGFLPEQPRVDERLLLAERLAGQVDVALRGREVGMTGPGHERRRRHSGRGRVRDRRMPAVVEGTHRPVDLRDRQRELERLRVVVRVERSSGARVAEDALVVALVARPGPVVEQLGGELLAERDRPFGLLGLRRVGPPAYPCLTDAERGASRICERDVTPPEPEDLAAAKPSPLPTTVRNTTRACSSQARSSPFALSASSTNARSTRPISTGERIVQRRRGSRGRSTAETGFERTSPRDSAALNSEWSRFRCRFTVRGAYPSRRFSVT